MSIILKSSYESFIKLFWRKNLDYFFGNGQGPDSIEMLEKTAAVNCTLTIPSIAKRTAVLINCLVSENTSQRTGASIPRRWTNMHFRPRNVAPAVWNNNAAYSIQSLPRDILHIFISEILEKWREKMLYFVRSIILMFF